MKKLLTVLMAIVTIFSCTKQEINTKSNLQKALVDVNVKPNLYQGPCPYECHDSRCKYYQSGYCGDSTNYTVNYQILTISNQSITNTMINAFNSLSVNMTELSHELGLSTTLTASNIDFQNLSESWDANSPAGKAITAPFKTNSNSNLYNYGFTMFTNGTLYIKPTIIKTSKNQYLKYFDLSEGLITTITNYASTNYSITDSTGAYISGNNISNSQNNKISPSGLPVAAKQLQIA